MAPAEEMAGLHRQQRRTAGCWLRAEETKARSRLRSEGDGWRRLRVGRQGAGGGDISASLVRRRRGC
ncbi:unnamed protein product [Linum trigynum]|uniref:Uncharacterized protein n=1 Tax=Linum trigynum TaxID=586398 RepID=A0AAV2E7N3_9ROSI